MKNRLQYLYSIGVFMGVLVTAYLMINSEGNSHAPFRALQQGPSLRTNEASIDPGLNQLFEMEEALAKLRKDKYDGQKRVPSELKRDIRKPNSTSTD